MDMRPCLLLLALSLVPSMSQAATPGTCHQGLVFDDHDGDGVRDAGEPGLAGIPMSNGRDIVRTDARGLYRLPERLGQPVFVVKPAGFSVHRRADGSADFWRSGQPGGQCAPIGLKREAAKAGEGDLRVLVFGDPQPKSMTDVGYFARDIVEPLVGHHDATLGVMLGDITHDDPALYPAIKSTAARLAVPWLMVPGNHDVDLGGHDDGDALHSFRAAFGADTFAWQEPQASFVVLDDVVSSYDKGQHRYIGGFREDQFAFLETLLPMLPKDRLLVVSMHIPLFETPDRDTFRDADRARLFKLLAAFPHVLVLSAHMHTQRHVFHGADSGWPGATPLHEYNVGATCGAFWSGVKDARGIPDTTMADGTPNGHAWLTVHPDGRYALDYRPAAPAADAIGLHAPKVLRRGAYPAWGLYANVWMGMDDTRVEYRVDGGAWKPMRRVIQPDPALLAENARDDVADALRGYDRSPEAVPSTHLWRGALPTDLAVGEHVVEVRAFDRWKGETTAKTTYSLQDAAP